MWRRKACEPRDRFGPAWVFEKSENGIYMDQELKDYLDALTSRIESFEARINTRMDSFEARMDGFEGRLGKRTDSLEARVESLNAYVNTRFESLETHMNARFDRMAEAMATEVGSLHGEIQDLDRRLRRVDANTITTLERLTRQSRWHEESDNAVRDLTARRSEFARKLNELRGGTQ
jgi:chromosome segregation ATPase